MTRNRSPNTTRIRLLKIYAHPERGCYRPNAIIEMPVNEADILIAAGEAEEAPDDEETTAAVANEGAAVVAKSEETTAVVANEERPRRGVKTKIAG